MLILLYRLVFSAEITNVLFLVGNTEVKNDKIEVKIKIFITIIT